jgi:hypothetical protein
VQLLSQVAGALLAGTLVLVFTHRCGLRPRQAVGSVAVVPIAVACLLALPGLHDAIVGLLDQRSASLPLSREEKELRAGAAEGMNVAFLAWAKAQLPDEQTFYPVVGKAASEKPITMQWLLFQLGPHLAVDDPSEADWLVFYESNPAQYRSVPLTHTMIYGPGFALARNQNAR